VVKTKSSRACPVCGTPFTGELCPVCVLRGALGNEQTVSQSVGPTLSTSELRFEHYEVLTRDDGTPLELGRGAMGVTYKALDVNLRYAVALKVINARFIGDESARRRFVREARAAASVRHPNVASVFHLGKSGDSYFYAMEFVDGESLDKVIRRSGRLDPSTALKVTTLVAAGLEAIDKQKLVHRDIKPSNIMVSMHGDNVANAKIIDLGLAKGTVADDGSISEISIQGTFAGTPAYASPEQFSGAGADIRSDLYSLGITLWEMLVGEVPFKGSTSRLIYQHQHATPPVDKLTQVPQPVIVLLEILLEKDPDRRLQTPIELLQVIPKVTEALESRQRVTTDQLRSGADRIVAKPKQSTRSLHPLLTGARMRSFGWMLVLVLGIAGLLLAWIFFSGYGGHFLNQRVAEAVSAEKSIAVLPFENISANKDDAYFADGVQDEILSNVARVSQLKVISRTSVMQYRADTKRDLRQIANALGVANILEGTVRRVANRVRITIELVDARTDQTIWSESYDRDLTDIFAIQSDVAQAVATRLSAQLSREERKEIEEKPTNNLEAYDLYLQAKQLLGPPNSVLVLRASEKGTFSKAISLLEEATQKDRKFALAYCMIAKAHDYMYSDRVDPTPERRALGDAAVNEALRLRPDLSEVHLAAAFHLFTCYRDGDRARVQIAIAAQALSNNPDLLQLTAFIDRVQGRWEKSTAGLERAATLDPRNPEILSSLADNYSCLRRYRDYERILDRLIELVPDQPLFPLYKAEIAWAEKADLKGVRAAHEAIPFSIKDEAQITWQRVFYPMCARDFAAADEIVSKSPNEEMIFFGAFGALVPRRIVALWLELVQGNHPTIEEFGAAREQLYRKVEADRTDPFLLTALALADVALGREEESIQEGRRAMEMRPISEDAIEGPIIAANVAVVLGKPVGHCFRTT
jgi:serine/threonine protein kinase/tetratricopeptide (TPR) repeat protein